MNTCSQGNGAVQPGEGLSLMFLAQVRVSGSVRVAGLGFRV